MFPLFNKLKARGKSQSKLTSYIKDAAELSQDINKKSKKLDEIEYETILEQKNETFISLADFLEIMDKKDISIKDILKVCKHISELDKSKFSFIDVYPLVEEDKIVLSINKDPSYTGDKIRIVTAKVLRNG